MLVPMLFQLYAFRTAIRSWPVTALCSNLCGSLVLRSSILNAVAEQSTMAIISILILTLRIAVWIQGASSSRS